MVVVVAVVTVVVARAAAMQAAALRSLGVTAVELHLEAAVVMAVAISKVAITAEAAVLPTAELGSRETAVITEGASKAAVRAVMAGMAAAMVVAGLALAPA